MKNILFVFVVLSFVACNNVNAQCCGNILPQCQCDKMGKLYQDGFVRGVKAFNRCLESNLNNENAGVSDLEFANINGCYLNGIYEGYAKARLDYIRPHAMKVIRAYRKFEREHKTYLVADYDKVPILFYTEIKGKKYNYILEEFKNVK